MFHLWIGVLDGIIIPILLIPTTFLAWIAFTKKDSKSPKWDRFIIEFLWVLLASSYLCSVLNPSGRSRIHPLVDLAAALYILAWRSYAWYRRRYPLIPSSEELHKQWLADQQKKAEREGALVVKACLGEVKRYGYKDDTPFVFRMEGVSSKALEIAQQRFQRKGWSLTYRDSNLVLKRQEAVSERNVF